MTGQLRYLYTGILCLLLFSLPGTVFPEKKDSTLLARRMDPEYLTDYKNVITTRIYLLYQPSVFTYQVPGFDDVRLEPNVQLKIGASVLYKWFGLGLSIYSPVTVINRDKYGKTTQIDLRLNFISNIWILEGYLQSTKGLYISNYRNDHNSYYTSEDLRLFAIGANAFWIQNHRKFSSRSVFNNNELQKRSAGSLMVQVMASYQQAKADSGIINNQFFLDYGLTNPENPNDVKTVYLGISPGYSYTLVFLKKLYLNGGIFPGLMWAYSQYESGRGQTEEWTMFPFMGIRGGFGYNSAKWHAGFSAITKVHGLSVSGDSPFYYDAPQFRIWVGSRFDVWKRKSKK